MYYYYPIPRWARLGIGQISLESVCGSDGGRRRDRHTRTKHFMTVPLVEIPKSTD